MSDHGNVNLFSNNIGALTNDFRPVVKVPSGFGGITLLSGHYTTETAGTSTVQIVDLGTAGTAVAAGGTIYATAGSAVAAPGVPVAMTVQDTAYVAEGHWIGVKENNVGTTGAITIISFSYLNGK
jgi:hypothetical protein